MRDIPVPNSKRRKSRIVKYLPYFRSVNNKNATFDMTHAQEDTPPPLKTHYQTA